MLKRICIERFRGISALTLQDLRRVNIFIGGNGAGKTSVLEAFGLAANPLNPGFLAQLSQWRDLDGPTLSNADAFRSFFPDLQIANSPRLTFDIDGAEHELVVQPLSSSQLTETVNDGAETSGLATDQVEMELRGVLCVYKPPNGEKVDARAMLIDHGFQTPPHKQPPRLGSFYVHARRATSLGETARLLTTLYEQHKDSELTEALKQIDNRVRRLWPGVRENGATVLVDVGLPAMLPINVLGDGFCRVSLMITGLLFGNSKLLIVDEVDSGLHHSVMTKFWASIISLGLDKQVFCSTHDEEMLEATLPAFAEAPEALAIFRLDRRGDGTVTAERYDYESFALAKRARLEVR